MPPSKNHLVSSLRRSRLALSLTANDPYGRGSPMTRFKPRSLWAGLVSLSILVSPSDATEQRRSGERQRRYDAAPGPDDGPAQQRESPSIESGGLLWMAKPADIAMNWSDATRFCALMRWRLPTKSELMRFGSVNGEVVSGVEGYPIGRYFWSSTRFGESMNSKYIVNVSVSGGSEGVGYVDDVYCVRCVRKG